MTPRQYFQAGSIPLCAIGAGISIAMGFALVLAFLSRAEGIALHERVLPAQYHRRAFRARGEKRHANFLACGQAHGRLRV